MILAALELEVEQYVQALRHWRLEPSAIALGIDGSPMSPGPTLNVATSRSTCGTARHP